MQALPSNRCKQLSLGSQLHLVFRFGFNIVVPHSLKFGFVFEIEENLLLDLEKMAGDIDLGVKEGLGEIFQFEGVVFVAGFKD